MTRKSDILISARKQFAERGFTGASLRHIAADAHVSLTLLNHHFGSKARLFAAVDDSCAGPGCRRTEALQHLMRDGTGTYSLDQLLATWVRADFEVAAQLDGESLLRFLARIGSDREIESRDVLDRLDRAGEILIDGFHGCFPQTSRRAAASAFLFASSATTNYLLNSERVFGNCPEREATGPVDGDEARLLRCLESGVEAAMRFEVASEHLATLQ